VLSRNGDFSSFKKDQRADRANPVQLLGISTGHAGQLLVTSGENIDRLRSVSSFAMLCGASPIPASSGKTTRHRLNYDGDRQANRAIHLIAVCRLSRLAGSAQRSFHRSANANAPQRPNKTSAARV
jgi:hypothetical protein